MYIRLLLVFILVPTLLFAQSGKPQRQILVTTADVYAGVTKPTIDITGSVYFSIVSNVASESSGKVQKVLVNEGDLLEANQPIAILDNELLQYSIEVATAKVNQAKLSLDKTKRDFVRNESLFKQNAIAEQKFQDSKTEYLTAENVYNSSLADYNKLKTELSKTTIKAPFKSVVISKNVNIGEWLTTGGKVAEVASQTFEARVSVPEKFLPYIKKSDNITILIDNKEVQGRILSINSKGDITTRTYQVRIDLANPINLKEAMLATARVPSGKNVKAFVVPRDSIVDRASVKGIFTLDNDTARFYPVSIIGYLGNDIAVKGDINAGDKVVVKGIEQVSNGAKVKVAKEGK